MPCIPFCLGLLSFFWFLGVIIALLDLHKEAVDLSYVYFGETMNLFFDELAIELKFAKLQGNSWFLKDISSVH
jgi:hypothetical protein